MAVETELKFPVPSLAPVRVALQGLGAVPCGSVFEQNIVLDDVRRSLRGRGMLLRLRRDSRHLLTLKRPLKGYGGRAKSLEEIETEVADPRAALAFLATLGYAPVLRYEKFRETWSLEGATVCLDTLPFGAFVEIEAGEERILAVAAALALDPRSGTADSYHALNAAHRARLGLAPDDSFVFDPA